MGVKNYLIDGVSCAGKTTVCDELQIHAEARLARIVDLGADDVRRQHVRRVLDAVEVQPEHACQRFHERRLAQSGHAFEQDVALDHERNQQAVHQIVLADEIAADLRAQRVDPVRRLADLAFRGRLVQGRWAGVFK